MLTRDARFSATLNEQARTPRLAVAGEIDSATADRFDEALRAAVRRCPRLIVDLSDVAFLGSSGIGSLFVHLDHIVAVAVAPGSIIARALSLAGYPRMILDHAPTHPGSQSIDLNGPDPRPSVIEFWWIPLGWRLNSGDASGGDIEALCGLHPLGVGSPPVGDGVQGVLVVRSRRAGSSGVIAAVRTSSIAMARNAFR